MFPVLAFILFMKTIALPVRAILRFGIHSGSGLLFLGILNGIGGLSLPINAVTVAMAGFGGLPGIGLIALLEAI